MVLIVDVWGVESSVGVAGQDGLSRGGAATGDDPAIAAQIGLVQLIGGGGRCCELFQALLQVALVTSPGRQDQELARLVSGKDPRRLLWPQSLDQAGPQHFGLEDAHRQVAHFVDH